MNLIVRRQPAPTLYEPSRGRASRPASPPAEAPDDERRQAEFLARRALVLRGLGVGWPSVVGIVLVLASIGLFLSIFRGPLQSAGAPYQLGKYIDFRSAGDAAPFLNEGWERAHDDGTATAGPVAQLLLPRAAPYEGELVLQIVGSPQYARPDTEFWMDLLANGARVGRWTLSRTAGPQRALAAIVRADIANAIRPLRLTLLVGTAHASPTAPNLHDQSGYRIEALRLFQRDKGSADSAMMPGITWPNSP